MQGNFGKERSKNGNQSTVAFPPGRAGSWASGREASCTEVTLQPRAWEEVPRRLGATWLVVGFSRKLGERDKVTYSEPCDQEDTDEWAGKTPLLMTFLCRQKSTFTSISLEIRERGILKSFLQKQDENEKNHSSISVTAHVNVCKMLWQFPLLCPILKFFKIQKKIRGAM